MGEDAKPEPDEHELVAGENPVGTVTLTGLYKNVGGERRRVYLTRDLGSYAEFNVADLIDHAPVPAADSPIAGETTTRLILKRGAHVDFTYTHRSSVVAHNQVDLDVQSGVAHGLTEGQPIPAYTIVKSTHLCTRHTIHAYAPMPFPSTVPCHYTIPTHTI